MFHKRLDALLKTAMERKLLTREELDRVLNPEAMTGPHAFPRAADGR